MKSTRLAVLNSLLFIRDPTVQELPRIDGLSAVWSTASCVAVSCLPDCDGETEVLLGRGAEFVQDRPLFDGLIATPSCKLIVETVLAKTILEIEVKSTRTKVRIWTDGHRDTDRVAIGLD